MGGELTTPLQTLHRCLTLVLRYFPKGEQQMSSLTIRLDKNMDAMLNQLAEVLQQNKSTVAREGIARYLEEQLSKHQARQELAASFSSSNLDAVKQRIAESEAGQYLTDDEYERSMNGFFDKELGLVR